MYRWRLFCQMILAFCLAFFSSSAQASPASLCEDAARYASQSTGVPLSVLRAVALAETGQTKFDKDDYSAWPWTVQSGNKGHWFDNENAAIQFVQSLMAEQRTNIDIGCFQLNMRWHRQAFQNLNDMFSPRNNALYAAQFLQKLYSQTGEWRAAVGRYHSSDGDRAEAYVLRLKRLYEAHLAGQSAPIQLPPTQRNRPPQQRFGLSGALGPLLLISTEARPLLGGRP